MIGWDQTTIPSCRIEIRLDLKWDDTKSCVEALGKAYPSCFAEPPAAEDYQKNDHQILVSAAHSLDLNLSINSLLHKKFALLEKEDLPPQTRLKDTTGFRFFLGLKH